MFRLHFLSLIATLFVACSPVIEECTPNSYSFVVDSIPVCVHPDAKEVKPEEVSQSIDVLQEELRKLHPHMTDIKKRLGESLDFIYFTPKKLSKECKKIEREIYECEEYLAGVIADGKRIYVGSWDVDRSSCLAYTSLIHELLHAVEYIYFGESLGDHEQPGFFSQNYETSEEIRNTIESRAKREAKKTLQSCQGN